MSTTQLAQWVRERRAELKLTQEEVAALGPMSDKTYRTIESGRATGLRSNTRLALEKALQWQANSVQVAIDKGIQPAPIAEKPRRTKRPTSETDDSSTGSHSPEQPRVEANSSMAGGLASTGASFAVARAALKLRSAVGLMRDTMNPTDLEAALADLAETQREAEIALSQAMQWIINDDAKRREAAKLLYELQQPL